MWYRMKRTFSLRSPTPVAEDPDGVIAPGAPEKEEGEMPPSTEAAVETLKKTTYI